MHSQGKEYVAEQWKLKTKVAYLEYEKLIKSELTGKYRIADVYIEDDSGYRVVNEVQISPIDKDEFLKRTYHYLDLNIDVVWWFHSRIYYHLCDLHYDEFGFNPFILVYHSNEK